MGRNGTKLGQNFLVDEAACVRIAESLGDVSGRTVVEIGPGHGAITQHLLHRCKCLHLIEFDPGLARELAFRFRDEPKVVVHHADVLQTDLSALVATSSGGTLDVVGNLPYYITSEILLHLYAAARKGLIRRAVVMTQREVAERVAATPGTSEYGALSALSALHASVTELFTLPPSAFRPPPEVFSTVFRLDFALRFEALRVGFEPFNAFLRSAFAQKRKTLLNNLKTAGFSAEKLNMAWPADLPPQARAEVASLGQLAALYRELVPSADEEADGDMAEEG